MVDANIVIWFFNQWFRLNVWGMLSEAVLHNIAPPVQLGIMSASPPQQDTKGEVQVNSNDLRLMVGTGQHVLLLEAMVLSTDWDWISALPPQFHVTAEQVKKAQDGKKFMALTFKDQLLWACQGAYEKAMKALDYRKKNGNRTLKAELFAAHSKIAFGDNAKPNTEALTVQQLAECFFSLAMFGFFVETNASGMANEPMWPEWRVGDGGYHLRMLAMQKGTVKAIDHLAIKSNEFWLWVEQFDATPKERFVVSGVASTHVTINDSMAFIGTIQARFTEMLNTQLGVELYKKNPGAMQGFNGMPPQ